MESIELMELLACLFASSNNSLCWRHDLSKIDGSGCVAWIEWIDITEFFELIIELIELLVVVAARN